MIRSDWSIPVALALALAILVGCSTQASSPHGPQSSPKPSQPQEAFSLDLLQQPQPPGLDKMHLGFDGDGQLVAWVGRVDKDRLQSVESAQGDYASRAFQAVEQLQHIYLLTDVGTVTLSHVTRDKYEALGTGKLQNATREAWATQIAHPYWHLDHVDYVTSFGAVVHDALQHFLGNRFESAQVKLRSTETADCSLVINAFPPGDNLTESLMTEVAIISMLTVGRRMDRDVVIQSTSITYRDDNHQTVAVAKIDLDGYRNWAAAGFPLERWGEFGQWVQAPAGLDPSWHPSHPIQSRSATKELGPTLKPLRDAVLQRAPGSSILFMAPSKLGGIKLVLQTNEQASSTEDAATKQVAVWHQLQDLQIDDLRLITMGRSGEVWMSSLIAANQVALSYHGDEISPSAWFNMVQQAWVLAPGKATETEQDNQQPSIIGVLSGSAHQVVEFKDNQGGWLTLPNGLAAHDLAVSTDGCRLAFHDPAQQNEVWTASCSGDDPLHIGQGSSYLWLTGSRLILMDDTSHAVVIFDSTTGQTTEVATDINPPSHSSMFPRVQRVPGSDQFSYTSGRKLIVRSSAPPYAVISEQDLGDAIGYAWATNEMLLVYRESEIEVHSSGGVIKYNLQPPGSTLAAAEVARNAGLIAVEQFLPSDAAQWSPRRIAIVGINSGKELSAVEKGSADRRKLPWHALSTGNSAWSADEKYLALEDEFSFVHFLTPSATPGQEISEAQFLCWMPAGHEALLAVQDGGYKLLKFSPDTGATTNLPAPPGPLASVTCIGSKEQIAKIAHG